VLGDLLLALLVVFGVNLLPAFGPPTWAVLVFFRVSLGVPAVPLVLGGALAAAAGRLGLATASRRLGGRVSPKRRASLDAAKRVLVGSRGRALAGLGLFALSPVPSAQLFVAAGMLRVPLLPLTASFFAGRLVSYSLYVGAASIARENIAELFAKSLSSPGAIALQLVMLGGLVALLSVDWAGIIARHGGRGGGAVAPGRQEPGGPPRNAADRSR
jgi:membrane protein YqaA with SNARE-associated domain